MPELKFIPNVRLAIRKEGRWLNAYWAQRDTMDGAVLVASISLRIIEDGRHETDRDLWDRWKALLGDALARRIADVFGDVPEMTEAPAPEHEKAGKA